MLSFILLLLASSTLQPSSLHLSNNYFISFFQRPWLPTKKKIISLLHNKLNNTKSTHLYTKWTESYLIFIIIIDLSSYLFICVYTTLMQYLYYYSCDEEDQEFSNIDEPKKKENAIVFFFEKKDNSSEPKHLCIISCTI